MDLKILYDKDKLAEEIKQRMDARKKKVVGAMEYAALEGVRYARKVNTYQDQTGNLRSSIGYILTDGTTKEKKESAFEKVTPKTKKKGVKYDGSQKGLTLAKKLAAGADPDSVTVTLVAGMEYADKVERGHTAKNGRHIAGRDVLSGAETHARKELEKLLKAIGK